MARPMRALAEAWVQQAHRQILTDSLLVHRAARGAVASSALAPGCKALTLEAFVARLPLN